MRTALLASTAAFALVGASAVTLAQTEQPADDPQQQLQAEEQQQQELQQAEQERIDEIEQQAMALEEQIEHYHQQIRVLQEHLQEDQPSLEEVREQGQELEQHAEQIHQHAEQLEQQLAGMQQDLGAQQQAEQDAEQPDEELAEGPDEQPDEQIAEEQPADDELAQQAAEMRERAEQLWQLTQQFNQELENEPRPEDVTQAVDHLEQEAVQLYEQVQTLRQRSQEMREVEVTEPADPEVEERQVAEACLQELREFSQRAREEGYWLAGWQEGWGQPGMAPFAPADPAAVPPEPGVAPAAPGAPGAVPAEDPAAQPEVAEGAEEDVAPQQQAVMARDPRGESRILYSAAYVFAQQGNEDGCMYVLSELEAHFEDHLARMEEAGVDPGEVQTWRQDSLVAAVPVEEAFPTVRMERIIDADLRNAQDEYLGYIDDAILDPESGEIAYVIVSYGGFLGFGEDSVAVPWEMLQYSPQMQTFVLNVSEETLENAPTVDAGELAQRDVYDQRREEIHGYWQEQQPGEEAQAQ